MQTVLEVNDNILQIYMSAAENSGRTVNDLISDAIKRGAQSITSSGATIASLAVDRITATDNYPKKTFTLADLFGMGEWSALSSDERALIRREFNRRVEAQLLPLNRFGPYRYSRKSQ